MALSLIQLLAPPGRIKSGQILYDNRDLLKMTPEQLRRVRGREIGMIYQDPGATLNPVYTIGSQIAEVLVLHRAFTKLEAEREAVYLLGEMGIPEPEKRAKSYPFELSGGMQQRALIAIAAGPRPRLLIADEPTTALDLTVQAEILDLLRYLKDQYQMATLLISTTSPWWPTWRTGSWSCTPADWWRWPEPGTCSRTRVTPTERPLSAPCPGWATGPIAP